MNKDRVVVITGAAGGIGALLVERFLANGDTVLATDIGSDALERLRDTTSDDAKLITAAADISREEDCEGLADLARGEEGRVEVLINCAGFFPILPFEEMSSDDWKRVIDINLTGSFLCTQEAIRIMKDQNPRGGRIINNGSISAHAPRPNTIAYTATKHAVTGLTKSTALDGRKYDIACSQIDIGNAATEMTTRMAQGVRQANGEVLVEPLLDLDHVARAVVYMAGLPLDANVQFMTLMATKMPFIGRG